MLTPTPSPTRELNRLRAAAALLRIIDDGLNRATLSPARARTLASFCEWSTLQVYDDPAAASLVKSVGAGLVRVQRRLAVAA